MHLVQALWPLGCGCQVVQAFLLEWARCAVYFYFRAQPSCPSRSSARSAVVSLCCVSSTVASSLLLLLLVPRRPFFSLRYHGLALPAPASSSASLVSISIVKTSRSLGSLLDNGRGE